MWTFRIGPGGHAAMLGSIQNFFATPLDAGIVGEPEEPEAGFGARPVSLTSLASRAGRLPVTRTPMLDPALVCRNRRRFVRCDITVFIV